MVKNAVRPEVIERHHAKMRAEHRADGARDELRRSWKAYVQEHIMAIRDPAADCTYGAEFTKSDEFCTVQAAIDTSVVAGMGAAAAEVAGTVAGARRLPRSLAQARRLPRSQANSLHRLKSSGVFQ